jgi:hypothetical protein
MLWCAPARCGRFHFANSTHAGFQLCFFIFTSHSFTFQRPTSVESVSFCAIIQMQSSYQYLVGAWISGSLRWSRAGFGIVIEPPLDFFLSFAHRMHSHSSTYLGRPWVISHGYSNGLVPAICLSRHVACCLVSEPRDPGIVPRVRLSWYISCISL